MSRRRTVVSAAFAVLTGVALFATAGSAAAGDVSGQRVLRIVTVQSEDPGCPRHEGSTPGQETDTRGAGQAGAGADAL